MSKLWEIVEDGGAWHSTVHEVSKSGTQLKDQTTATVSSRPDWRGLKQRTLGIEDKREVKDGKCP